ncbi:MAG: M56 family metallopeptidase [Fimbriimonas sp.]
MSANDFLAVLLRTGLVLALAFGVDALLRRSAAVRSYLLRAALAATVVAAVLPPMLRERVRPVVMLPAPTTAPLETPPPAAVVAPIKVDASAAASTVSVPPAPDLKPAPAPAATAVAAFSPPFDWPLALWALGALGVGGYWSLAHIAVVRLRRRGQGVTSGAVHSVLAATCAEQRVPVPELSIVPNLASPLVCGIVSPCVLIPQEMADRENRTELAAALAHEVAHLARRDVPWTYATRAVQTVLWFQPLVWGFHPRLAAASEELCDLQAVQGGLRRETYADCLLRLAEAASRPRIEGTLGSGMATKRSSLSTRIEALLDSRRTRSTRLPPRSRMMVTAGVAALAVGGGFFAAAPAAAQPRREQVNVIPGTQQEGRALFAQTLAKYTGAKTLSFTVAGSGFRAHIRYQSPNRLWAEYWDQSGGGRARKLLVADGKTVTVYDETEPMEVVVAPQDATPLAKLMGRQVRLIVPFALQVAATTPSEREQPERAIAAGTLGLSGAQRRTIVIEANGPVAHPRPSMAIRVDAEGKILENEVRSVTADGKTFLTTEIYSNVRFDEPLGNDAFRFTPPPGAKVVAPFKPELRQSAPALALARRIEEAPKGLTSIAFEVERVEQIHHQGGSESSSRIVRKIEYRNDGSARIEEDYPDEWGDVLVVSDGKSLTARSTKSREKVVRQPLDPNPYARMRQLLIAAEYRVPHPGFGELIEMANLGWASVYNLPRFSMELGTKTRIDGEVVDVLVLRESFQKMSGAPAAGGIVSHVYVDGKGFIRRMEKATDYGNGQKNEEVVEVRNLRLNPTLPDSRFRMDIPANFTTIDSGSKGRDEETASYQPHAQLQPGETPPTTRFTTLDGRTLDLPSLKGKVVILHAWTFGVTNYEQDLPRLQALHRKYAKDGLVVIAVCVSAGATRESILKHIQKHGLTYTHVIDGPGYEGPLVKAWNLHSYPFQLIIGRNGVVRARNVADDKLEENVKVALAD